MKKYLSGLITGVLASALVFSASVAALAASGNVSFNLSAIKFNGEVISEAGEDYTLPNGCAAPASITYTDEKGGGTTYLPVRRIGELAGVTIDWDGAVVVKSKEFVEKEERDAERAAALDYSNWSAEDEAAYQEFKGLWNITLMADMLDEAENTMTYWARSDKTVESSDIDDLKTMATRMARELYCGRGSMTVMFFDETGTIGSTYVSHSYENVYSNWNLAKR